MFISQLVDLFLQGRISSARPGWTWWASCSWYRWLRGTSWSPCLILTAKPRKNQEPSLSTTDCWLENAFFYVVNLCVRGRLANRFGFFLSSCWGPAGAWSLFAFTKTRLNSSKSRTQPLSVLVFLIMNISYSQWKLIKNYNPHTKINIWRLKSKSGNHRWPTLHTATHRTSPLCDRFVKIKKKNIFSNPTFLYFVRLYC